MVACVCNPKAGRCSQVHPWGSMASQPTLQVPQKPEGHMRLSFGICKSEHTRACAPLHPHMHIHTPTPPHIHVHPPTTPHLHVHPHTPTHTCMCTPHMHVHTPTPTHVHVHPPHPPKLCTHLHTPPHTHMHEHNHTGLAWRIVWKESSELERSARWDLCLLCWLVSPLPSLWTLSVSYPCPLWLQPNTSEKQLCGHSSWDHCFVHFTRKTVMEWNLRRNCIRHPRATLKVLVGYDFVTAHIRTHVLESILVLVRAS